jgi:hypothetical protein
MKTVWGALCRHVKRQGRAGQGRRRSPSRVAPWPTLGQRRPTHQALLHRSLIHAYRHASPQTREERERPQPGLMSTVAQYLSCCTVCWQWAWAKSHAYPPESILVSPRCCVFALILGTVWVPSPTARICHVPAPVDAPSREDLRHGRFLFWPSALKRNLWALSARKEMDLRAPRGLSQRPCPARRGRAFKPS